MEKEVVRERTDGLDGSALPPPLVFRPTTTCRPPHHQAGSDRLLFSFSFSFFFSFSYLLVLIQLYFKNWILFYVWINSFAHEQVSLFSFFFYFSDFIWFMRKIIFMFGLYFAFCSRWDKEERKRVRKKEKGRKEKKSNFLFNQVIF